MKTGRMAIPIQDDRGTYSFPPGARELPFGRAINEADDYGPTEVRVVEGPLVGWGRWKWHVKLGARDYFVTGNERPT